MTSRHHFTEEVRWRVVGTLDVGQSQTEVARWLNGSPSGIYTLLQQFFNTDSIPRGSAKDGHTLPRMLMTDLPH